MNGTYGGVGYIPTLPTTSLNVPMSTTATETRSRTSALDVINSIGSLVLTGIVLSRVPKTSLQAPTTPITPVQREDVNNVPQGQDTQQRNLMLVIGLVIVGLVIVLIMRK